MNEKCPVEKKTEKAENVCKPASGFDKTKSKTRVRIIVNDEKPEETLKSDSLTTAKTPASKEVKDDERNQMEVPSNIRPPSTGLVYNTDKIITVKLGSKPEHYQRHVFIAIENVENRNKFIIRRAPKPTPMCQLKRCQSKHNLIGHETKNNNKVKYVDIPHKINIYAKTARLG
ncbi:uncharacterized protein LOC143237577 [Tachypleus tridentatus]|uniref:uncharacterized protein LOC143237577 n=1 Tax=Tachypleus tridentatus TaxID=6853 RepID=UPI003FD13369